MPLLGVDFLLHTGGARIVRTIIHTTRRHSSVTSRGTGAWQHDAHMHRPRVATPVAAWGVGVGHRRMQFLCGSWGNVPQHALTLGGMSAMGMSSYVMGAGPVSTALAMA